MATSLMTRARLMMRALSALAFCFLLPAAHGQEVIYSNLGDLPSNGNFAAYWIGDASVVHPSYLPDTRPWFSFAVPVGRDYALQGVSVPVLSFREHQAATTLRFSVLTDTSANVASIEYTGGAFPDFDQVQNASTVPLLSLQFATNQVLHAGSTYRLSASAEGGLLLWAATSDSSRAAFSILGTAVVPPPPPPPPSPIPRGPRLFGIAIGENDGGLMRNDITAEAVFTRLQSMQGWAGAFTEGNSITSLSVDSATGGPTFRSLVALMSSNMSVQPGDTLVVYLGAHGGQVAGSSDETPLVIQDLVFPNAGGLLGIPTLRISSEDETIRGLTDDQLANLFSGSEWENVNKIFILDACFGGGFWGDPQALDGGDLNRLPRTSLFASSRESEFTLINVGTRRSFYSESLLDSLDAILASGGAFSLSGLNDQIQSRFFDGVIELAGLAPESFSAGTTVENASLVRPVFFHTLDIDVSVPLLQAAPVPEPSTIVLFLLGLVFLLRLRHKTRVNAFEENLTGQGQLPLMKI